MGIGMVIVCAPENVSRLKPKLPEIIVIGEVHKQGKGARIVIE
jgi:phosphoribosylaminoimidazole (AIR) synthetase